MGMATRNRRIWRGLTGEGAARSVYNNSITVCIIQLCLVVALAVAMADGN